MNPSLLLAATSLLLLPSPRLSGAGWCRPTQTHPVPKPKPRPQAASKAPTYGAKADSLDGIPGHHFGEPRSNFPELAARGFPGLDGYVSYSLRPGQEATGWFGKNAEQVEPSYWFYQDQFAGFAAVVLGPDSQRQLLADEAAYLFGPGLRTGVAFGQTTTRWDGKKVLVEYVDGHNEGRLVLNSKLVLAQVAAAKLARQRAEAAARAAKFKADNAPPAAH
jgi:hypothetical protein